MAGPIKAISEQKDKLHPRNRHKYRYNFPELTASCPGLSKYVSLNQYQQLSVDFKNPEAVKMLNKALLKHFYRIDYWDIPSGYLCPPIPGRADYIHYLADLLAEVNGGKIPEGKDVKVLDIGTGANCIYPLIGTKEYGWSFTGADSDPVSVQWARKIAADNQLSEVIEIRKQNSQQQIFSGIINPGERFDLTLCNPPFHASQTDALAGTARKWKNLGHTSAGNTLNFGGRNNELWYPGGEEAFVKTMIKESTLFQEACLWFTTLISKKDTLPACYKALDSVKAFDVKTITMSQGQKTSRLLAWTFLDKEAQNKWCRQRFSA